MNKTLWIVVLIIIIALAWWLFSGRGDEAPTEVDTTDETAAAVEAVNGGDVVEDVVDEATEQTVEDEA